MTPKVAEERAFTDGLDEWGGEGDEVVGLRGYGVGQRSADGFAVEDDVGVGEEEVVGVVDGDGVAGGEGHGVGLA